jgi:hypothetical protein
MKSVSLNKLDKETVFRLVFRVIYGFEVAILSAILSIFRNCLQIGFE